MHGPAGMKGLSCKVGPPSYRVNGAPGQPIAPALMPKRLSEVRAVCHYLNCRTEEAYTHVLNRGGLGVPSLPGLLPA